MKTNDIYKIYGTILSPVHIGTGEEWEPMEYYIDAERKRLVKFQTEKILANLDEAEQVSFINLTESENLNPLKNFITERAKNELKSQSGIFVTDEIADLYAEKINDVNNQLLINPMIRDSGTNQVILPGSSIKGAIRTAVISEIAKTSELLRPIGGREEYQFESKVLKYQDARNDPFRTIKITDSFLNQDSTFICQVYNANINRNGILETNNIQLIHEVTHSYISSHIFAKNVEFESELRIDQGLIDKRAVSKAISIQNIIQNCNSFYRDKMIMEDDRFFLKSSFVKDFSKELVNYSLKENECLIRVGRYSGVESVTLDKYRNPQPPGRTKKWGGSRNLADGRFPMGWVKLRFEKV